MKSNNKSVTTICYGTERVWDNREEAIAYFLDGMVASEGSEQERYTNIYLALKAGNKVCRDEG